MQRLAHARRLRARNELAEQDDALGVGRPLRRLLAERRVERIDERFGGRGHRVLLLCSPALRRLTEAVCAIAITPPVTSAAAPIKLNRVFIASSVGTIPAELIRNANRAPRGRED